MFSYTDISKEKLIDLERGLDGPDAVECAQRLLSEYGFKLLGMRLYKRAKRTIRRARTPRHRVMGRNPGRPNEKQRQEIEFLAAVDELRAIVELEKD